MSLCSIALFCDDVGATSVLSTIQAIFSPFYAMELRFDWLVVITFNIAGYWRQRTYLYLLDSTC